MPQPRVLVHRTGNPDRARHLLDQLNMRLIGTARVHTDQNPARVTFYDDPSADEQHRKVTRTLDQLDPDWRDALTVEGA